jgi:SAM-dependent methyltransferase
MTRAYTYDHEWLEERRRLAGLETALDPGTRRYLTELGVKPGARCLEVGAGGGSIARWMAGTVAPHGEVVATDLEPDYLQAQTADYPCLTVLRHDVTAEPLPVGFDVVHARWLVEWLPDKPAAVARLAAALRPGGALLIEEPDFVTMKHAVSPPALQRVTFALQKLLEAMTPVEIDYGRRAMDDLLAAGLTDVNAEGRCPIVRGDHPLSIDFLHLTIAKVKSPLLTGGEISEADYDAAISALQDPGRVIVTPMTVAAWGRRPADRPAE